MLATTEINRKMAHASYVRFSYFCLLFILFNISISKSLGLKNQECEMKGPCRCLYMNGMGIDLSPLNNNTPSFLNVSTVAVAYFYHPCSNQKLLASNTSVGTGGVLYFYHTENVTNSLINTTEVVQNGTGFMQLGVAEGASFQDTMFGQNGAQLQYKVGNITATVKLVCKNDAVSQLIVSTPDHIDLWNHDLQLQSPHACPRVLQADPTDQSHVSTGSVLLVIFFTFGAAYFIGGALVLKFIRGAEGREMIPNYEFWADLPYLVRDGCVFALSCGQRTPDSYERI